MPFSRLMGHALVVASLGLSGCTVMPDEASLDFASNLRSDGPNPLLRYQAMRDLEAQLRNYVLLPTPDARMDYLLDLTAPQLGLDITGFRTIAQQLDQGAEANVIRLFGRQPSGSGPCAVKPTASVPFIASDEAAVQDPIVWRFVAGDCVDGEANGLASVTSQDGTKTFTGQFANGEAIDGVYVDDARHLVRIGPLAAPGAQVRAVWRRTLPGKVPVYYVGDSVDGQAEGIGAYAYRYTDIGLWLIEVGHYQEAFLKGFGARHDLMNFLEGGRTWGVRIGTWQKGKVHGLAGWTDNAEELGVGTYENGQLRGIAGIYFADLADPYGTERWFRFGGYLNGERHGGHIVRKAWTGIETQESWNHGEFVGDDGFDFGQLLALGGGAAMLGMAEIPDAAKIQLGGGYLADVMTEGDGSLTAATGAAIANGMAAQNGSSAPQPSSQASSQAELRHESYSFTCDHGGSHTINVPYLDAARLSYKKAYAKAMACNEIDNMASAVSDCQRVFGNRMCVEQ